MSNPLDDHAQFITTHGFTKWVLRECVRANPLYVISAALLAYGVFLLESEADQSVGSLMGKLLAFSLMNVYELAVLAVATIILKVRKPVGSGGRDLHGLMLVMLLYLGGSFLAQDEVIAAMPEYGITLVLVGLILAALKLAWYGRLPGVLLPWKFQLAMLGMLAGHSMAPLWNGAGMHKTFGIPVAQGLAWMLGWLTLIPVFLLVWKVEREAAPDRNFKREEFKTRLSKFYADKKVALENSVMDSSLQKPEPEPNVDFLATRFFGHVGLVMIAIMGVVHLIGSDYVFDRPADKCRSFPALTLLLAAALAFLWHYRKSLGFWGWGGFSAPALTLNLLWFRYTEAWNIPATWTWSLFLHPLAQVALSMIVFYVGLSWTTGRKRVLLGLLGLCAAPAGWGYWYLKQILPYFRAVMFVSVSFLALFLGMLISLYRQRILRLFEPRT